MSSEEHFAVTDGDKTDEQIALEQEREDEEREVSFQFQREQADRHVEPTIAGEGNVLEPPISTEQATEAGSSEAAAAAAEEEVAAVEEATTAATSGSSTARNSRKSRASGSGPSTTDAESEQTRKRARKSTATASTAGAESQQQPEGNVRLDRLRQALFRFLDLIEHRATSSSFAKALPHIDAESVEALRLQFVGQLKEAIIDESEKLIESNDLEEKLASLHRLAHEADARYHAGFPEGAAELKDVWRKELDLETAISAKAIPDQEKRVKELKAELELVRKQNHSIHAELLRTRSRCDAIQGDARDSLDALDSAIKGLEATPDMQKQLRQTMDDLLQDLGARV